MSKKYDKLYNSDSIYYYISLFEPESTLGSHSEGYFAHRAYLQEREAGKIDSKLIPYLDAFFDLDVLVPIFSCEGHSSTDQGYVVFRSLANLEDTVVKIFKPVLLRFSNIEGVDLKLHIWPNGSLGYVLYFSKDSLEKTLSLLIKTIKLNRHAFEVTDKD